MNARAAWTWISLLSLAACHTSTPGIQAHNHLHIQTLQMPGLQSVQWDFQFWFLDSSPAQNYLETQATGAEVDGTYLCLVGAGGTGHNQVQATVTLTFIGQSTPIVGKGAALFTCKTGVDTPIDIVIPLQIPATDGYPDLDAQATVVSCTPPQLQWKGDDWLAVCGTSSCGDSNSALLFSQSCSGTSGFAPELWTCGPSDWTQTIHATAQPPYSTAVSQFAVPPGDGTWTFSVAALAQLTLSQPDLSLTDANGRLLVHADTATPTATLVRQGGVATAGAVSTRYADWAIELSIPAGSSGTTTQLAVFRLDASGTHASVWQSFGACDAPILGTSSFTGLFAVDARLVDSATVELFFASQPGGLVSQTAICAAIRQADGTPQISCSNAGPLS